jgi:hypothetical protein
LAACAADNSMVLTKAPHSVVFQQQSVHIGLYFIVT